MSQIKLKHSGGNSVIIAAPDSNPASDRTLKLPSDGDGTILTSNSSVGKILQVISSNKITVQSTSSTSYVDVTDMTATITPSASTSKVLILLTMVIQKSNYTFFARLLRGSTEIGTPSGSNSGLSVYNSGDSGQNEGRTHVYLDSPNTTNATTYKLQIKSDGSSTIYFNAHSSGTTNDYISQSSFTVIEVAA